MVCDLPMVVTDVLTVNLFTYHAERLLFPFISLDKSGLDRQRLVHPGARLPGQNDYRPCKCLLKIHGAY